jgi:hypothetical protein
LAQQLEATVKKKSGSHGTAVTINGIGNQLQATV